MTLPRPRVLLPHCGGRGPLSTFIPGVPKCFPSSTGVPPMCLSRTAPPHPHPLCYRVPKKLPLIKPGAGLFFFSYFLYLLLVPGAGGGAGMGLCCFSPPHNPFLLTS